MAIERVGYVGEPVALVIAETLDAAKDAAESIFRAEPSLSREQIGRFLLKVSD